MGIKQLLGLESPKEKAERKMGEMRALREKQQKRIRKAVAERPVGYQFQISESAPLPNKGHLSNQHNTDARIKKPIEFGNTADRKMDSSIRGELTGHKRDGQKQGAPFTFG